MKEMNTPVGFLVVLAKEIKGESPETQPNNRYRYSGVGRVPALPTDYQEEEDAMWDYVCNPDVKDETNLIPSLDKAEELHKRLSQGRRKFEIVFCCQGPDSGDLRRIESRKIEPLGYDVVTISACYWSLVEVFCRSDWATTLKARLNEFGLFNNRRDAEQYLEGYRSHGEPDSDADFDVVYVVRILTEK